MDEISHTILPNNGGWGGSALGAGFGGLIGSWLGNGGFGGFGNRAGVGYDTGAINAIQGQLNNLKALCKYDESQQVQQTTNIAAEQAPLIDMGLLNDKGTGTNIRSNASDNQRERAKNNR